MARRILPALAVLALVLTAQATPARAPHRHDLGDPHRSSRLPAAGERARDATRSRARRPSPGSPSTLTGGHYQFQLATSRSFEDATLVFKDANVSQPAETVTAPAALDDRRARTRSGRACAGCRATARAPTPWSKPFGFNIQWATGGIPQQIPAPEGLIRWTPIDGATAYEVLYPDLEAGALVPDDDERRRRARVLHLRRHARIHDDPLARPRDPRRSASSRARATGFRPCRTGRGAPSITTLNTPGDDRHAHADRHGLGRLGQGGEARLGASAHARLRLAAERARRARRAAEPLPGLRLLRQELREPDLHRLGRRAGPAWAAADGVTDCATQSRHQRSARCHRREPSSPTRGRARSGLERRAATGSSSAPRRRHPAAHRRLGSVDLWDSGWPTGRFYWTVVPVSGPAILPRHSRRPRRLVVLVGLHLDRRSRPGRPAHDTRRHPARVVLRSAATTYQDERFRRTPARPAQS